MKKIFIILTLVMLLSFVGCGKENVIQFKTSEVATDSSTENTTTEMITTETTEKASETVEKTKTPTTSVKKDTSYNRITKEELRHMLLNNRWFFKYVLDDNKNEVEPQVAYGSIIFKTGAELKFNRDGTFWCVLGSVGCKGKYTVGAGTINLDIKKEYSGAKSGKVSKKAIAYYRYLEREKEEEEPLYDEYGMPVETQPETEYFHTIAFDYSYGENYFYMAE